jgi:hypothetical protein
VTHSATEHSYVRASAASCRRAGWTRRRRMRRRRRVRPPGCSKAPPRRSPGPRRAAESGAAAALPDDAGARLRADIAPARQQRPVPHCSGGDVFMAYVVVTGAPIIASLAIAIADLRRAKFVLANSAELGVPQSWLRLLAALRRCRRAAARSAWHPYPRPRRRGRARCLFTPPSSRTPGHGCSATSPSQARTGCWPSHASCWPSRAEQAAAPRLTSRYP